MISIYKHTLHKLYKSLRPVVGGTCGLWVAVLFSALFIACANIGSPDGGAYDETPPRVTHTSPKYGSVNTKSKKIIIQFNENVQLDGATEKVVISPPQIEMPDIEANGKRITITLNDSLQPNRTYTIDFSDAIKDSNEGNPMGQYAFTFSTGTDIDTMQVSGYVLEAENLEPIKGMLVGLYKVDTTSVEGFPDSLICTAPLERIARTDSRGMFTVKGLARARYRVFALNDQDQTFTFSQRGEKMAFSDLEFTPTCSPDLRSDTVWHDSIHYDSIVMSPYTHFYPDDIVLRAFTHIKTERLLSKAERPTLQQFMLKFSARSDTLPLLTGLNFDVTPSTFFIDSNKENDSINYWIRDSLIYNIDTLEIKLDFYATDSTGNLALTVDTLYLVPKLTKEKLAKQRQAAQENWEKEYRKQWKAQQKAEKALAASRKGEKEQKEEDDADEKQDTTDVAATDPVAVTDTLAAADSLAADTLVAQSVPAEIDTSEPAADTQVAEKEDSKSSSSKKSKKKSKKKEEEFIDIPPMPEEFLEYKAENTSSLDPNKNVIFTFPEPLDSAVISRMHFSLKVDTIQQPAPYIMRRSPDSKMSYTLYAEWVPDSTYVLELDTAAFVSIYGKRSEAVKYTIKVKSLSTYSTLFVVLTNADPTATVQLLDASDKVVQTVKSDNGKADFYFVMPNTYYMRLFNDLNGNGEWDTGDYDAKLQPEPVFYYSNPVQLKADWEITQTWDVSSTPLYRQKPDKLTKQKADKAKVSTHEKNLQRLEEKKNGSKKKQ